MNTLEDIVIYQPRMDAVLLQLRWRDLAYHAAMPPRLPARPFLVVTPCGAGERDELLAALTQCGVRLRGPLTLTGWSQAATRLFVRKRTYESLARAAAYEWLWERLSDTAQLWWLGGMGDYVRLMEAKNELLAAFPGEEISLHLHLPGKRFKDVARLHRFHVPAPQHLATEGWLLRGSTGN